MALKFGKKGLRNVLTDAEMAAISALFEKHMGLGNVTLKGPAINIPELKKLLSVGLNKNNTNLVQDAIDRTQAFLNQPPPGGGASKFPGDKSGLPTIPATVTPGGVPGGGGPLSQIAGGGGAGGHGGGGTGVSGHGGQGGFSSQGFHIPAPFTTPQSDGINRMFEDLLNGIQREPEPIEVLDPDLIAALEQSALGLINTDASTFFDPSLISGLQGTISQLLEGQGLPDEVLRSLQNRSREGLATRERELLQRRGAEFANRNAFGSGSQVRALEEIERAVTGELSNAFSEIGLLDAQASERNRLAGVSGGTAFGGLMLGAQELEGQLQQAGQQGLLNLGNLNLATESTSINEALARQGLDLDALQLAISRELGLGDLSLGQDTLELERQLQELLQNLLLQQNFFASEPTGEAGGAAGEIVQNALDRLNDLLGGGRDNGGGFIL